MFCAFLMSEINIIDNLSLKISLRRKYILQKGRNITFDREFVFLSDVCFLADVIFPLIPLIIKCFIIYHIHFSTQI